VASNEETHKKLNDDDSKKARSRLGSHLAASLRTSNGLVDAPAAPVPMLAEPASGCGCLCSARRVTGATHLQAPPVMTESTDKLTATAPSQAWAPAHRARGEKTPQHIDRTLDRPRALLVCARRAPCTIRALAAAGQ